MISYDVNFFNGSHQLGGLAVIRTKFMKNWFVNKGNYEITLSCTYRVRPLPFSCTYIIRAYDIEGDTLYEIIYDISKEIKKFVFPLN